MGLFSLFFLAPQRTKTSGSLPNKKSRLLLGSGIGVTSNKRPYGSIRKSPLPADVRPVSAPRRRWQACGNVYARLLDLIVFVYVRKNKNVLIYIYILYIRIYLREPKCGPSQFQKASLSGKADIGKDAMAPLSQNRFVSEELSRPWALCPFGSWYVSLNRRKLGINMWRLGLLFLPLTLKRHAKPLVVAWWQLARH